MIDTHETFEVAGLTVRIRPDEDAPNPRTEFDHVGTMVCWHDRYELGDQQPDCAASEFWLCLMQEREWDDHRKVVPDDLPGHHVERYLHKHFYFLPLYLYDHSGLTMSTDSYSCPWDSGQVGWIYMSKDKAAKERLPDPLACLRMEVAEYDQYLQGDVWGYEIEGASGDVLDSCWGFFGFDHCKEQATESATAIAERLASDFDI